MAKLCIPQFAADAIKQALEGRDIQIADLITMSPEKRTAIFEKYAGKEAKTLETLFESKLVLKNKELGLMNFLAQATLKGRYSVAQQAELKRLKEEFKQAQRERILSPKEGQTMLANLAEKVLGAKATPEQFKALHDMTVKVAELAKQWTDPVAGEEVGTWSSPKAKAEYAGASSALYEYTEALLGGDATIKNMLQEVFNETKETWKTNKPKAISDLLIAFIKTIADNSVSLVASVDLSYMGRQGLFTLFTHPSNWVKGAFGGTADFFKTLGGQNAKLARNGMLFADEFYMSGLLQEAKVVPKHEEETRGSLPERIPFFGRIFSGSQTSFETSAMIMRVEGFKTAYNTAKVEGEAMDKQVIKDLGTVVSSITARGTWGKKGEGALVRVLLWAPKMLKANWDVLTGHTLGTGLTTKVARQQAAINLLKIVSVSAFIMAFANALKPGSAEKDPRSSNFGKIKIGNTTFSYSGSAGSLVVLGARLLTGQSKSNATGLVRDFGTGYGQQTRFDALIDFLTNKTTPPVSAAIAILKGTNPVGKKTTPATVATGLAVPISIQNAIELKDDASVAAVWGVLADVFGISTNTYIAGATDWTQSTGKELPAFRAKIGDTKFREANDLYNQRVRTFIESIQKNPRFVKLSTDDKQRVITKAKGEIKDRIFRQYGFRYRQERSRPLPKF